MYSSSSRTRCLLVVVSASPAARFLRGRDTAGSNKAPADAPGVSIPLPGSLYWRKRVTVPGRVLNRLRRRLLQSANGEAVRFEGRPALRSDITASPCPHGSCSLYLTSLWSCVSRLWAAGGAVVEASGRVVHANREKFQH